MQSTAGILTYDKYSKTRRYKNTLLPLLLRSNTGMVVAPESNRITFSSTQLTTFQTVLKLLNSIYYSKGFFAIQEEIINKRKAVQLKTAPQLSHI
jgi:hypothetical protein